MEDLKEIRDYIDSKIDRMERIPKSEYNSSNIASMIGTAYDIREFVNNIILRNSK